MKMFLAAVALVALLTPSVFAQAPRGDGQPPSAISLKHNRQFRGGPENLYFHVQPTPNPESMQQGLCDTSHDFCSGFYGDNG